MRVRAARACDSKITFRLNIEFRPLVSAAMPKAKNALKRATYVCLLVAGGASGAACGGGGTADELQQGSPQAGAAGSGAAGSGGAAGVGSGGVPGSAGTAGAGAAGSAGGAGSGSAGSGSAGGGSAGSAGGGSAGGGSAGTPGNPVDNSQNQKSPLGTNLGPITDYSGEWAFVDAMKSSRAWTSGTGDTWDDGRTVDVDEHGWVRSLASGQIARTVMFWDAGDDYPQGEYVVLYEGKGTIEYAGGAQKNAAASKPGRDVINVGKGGIGLNITAVDKAAPLKNIRVIMPGGVCSNDGLKYCDASTACDAGATCQSFEQNHATQIFHPQFLEKLAPYRVIRFMDWSATNNSTQKAWSDRPMVDDARWTIAGAPIEIMIELTNRLGADPWFTVYHQADDAYVRAWAALVKERLNPNVKAYVEHSNEVWNGAFEQSKYMEEQGKALGLSSDAFEAAMRYHAKRSAEIFALWSAALPKERLVRVLGSQAANSFASTAALDFAAAKGVTDALAIAPYFGGDYGSPDQVARVRGMTPEQLLTELETKAVPQAVSWIKDQAAIAKAHGVKLISYEGGQHLAGIYGAENDEELNALFDAVNRHPRMKSVYTSYLDAWRQNGGELFVHYVNCMAYSKWGRWGALESLHQARTESPKYDALVSFIEKNPMWW